MNYFPENLKHLRKERELRQADLAEKLGVNRTAVGAYEEGRAEPKLSTLRNISLYFDITIDALLHEDLSSGKTQPKADLQGKGLRILPITIDKSEDKELIDIVPVKAAAGYLNGYGDVDFVEALPHFSLPVPELGPNNSYRVFQIEGDSMLPVTSGSYVIGEYLQDWKTIKSEQCYILLTKDDGVVYKRVVNNLDYDATLMLKSDNPKYKPFEVGIEDVLEVWNARGFISFDLPDGNSPNVDQITQMLAELKSEVSEIKRKKQA